MKGDLHFKETLNCTLEDANQLAKSNKAHNAVGEKFIGPQKIIVQGRSSKLTKVGDIMTEENKLITVTPETKVIKAMELMTDNRIRHIPVINDKGMMGMVSIGDVVCAVVSEYRQELDRLNAYIQGGY
ncbi:CBS domain-containing protein cbsx3, mitochondrial [Stylosanthes scabra]|uniref:CBS domain-containing protein cbsx3, mitochondrial n=1 Tax=Stylosanthes scabra TaxID=79078 RepID=A0ABU6WN80_9FABA|nr:CBS domain-containing protein cbsx3, mitochondrial [Stylosanthes scabra]